MKKVYVFFVTILSVLLLTSNAFAGEEFVDQSSTSGTGSLRICTGSTMYQTFTPTVNRIHKVEIEASHASGQIKSNIKTLTGDGWQDVNYPEVIDAVDGWNTFDFIDFPVTPGDIYAISVFADCSSGAQWKYAAGNPYKEGLMIFQSNEKSDWDFNFKVIGQIDESLISQTPGSSVVPETTTTTTTTTITTATNGDDASNSQVSTQTEDGAATGLSNETLGKVSSAIAKPGELSAKYSAKDKTVSLTWKASTTKDISGYMIFRSNQENTGYLKLGQVKSDKFEIIDKNPTSNKTLYYQVRAFKDNLQSASSNTAKVTIPVIAKKSPVATNTNALAQEQKTFLEKSWPYFLILLLAIAAAVILIVKKYKLAKKIPSQKNIDTSK